MSVWLSPRQCEVLLHLAEGESFKWIGYKLGVSTSTVTETARNAYRKLGVANRYDAVEKHGKHRPRPSRMCRVQNA